MARGIERRGSVPATRGGALCAYPSPVAVGDTLPVPARGVGRCCLRRAVVGGQCVMPCVNVCCRMLGGGVVWDAVLCWVVLQDVDHHLQNLRRVNLGASVELELGGG